MFFLSSFLISDFELGIEENRYKQINQFLEITSFYLDNIDTIIFNTTPEFIFQIKSLDKWFVFKNLMTMEAALKFSLASAKLIPFDEYFQNSHNRAKQTLLLRPDKISLEKFKSIFIEKNADLEFIDTVIKYLHLYFQFFYPAINSFYFLVSQVFCQKKIIFFLIMNWPSKIVFKT